MSFAVYRRWSLLLIVSCSLLPSVATGQEWLESVNHHWWGPCGVGSWKKVRVVTDILDSKGKVTSTTKSVTTTTLMKADRRDYVLRMEVEMQLGEKRFVAEPRTVTRNFFFGDNQKARFVQTGRTANLKINGHTIPGTIREVTLNSEKGQRVSSVHYSAQNPPYVFKRKTTASDGKGQLQYTTEMDVNEYGIAHKVLGESKRVCHIKTVHAQDKLITTTNEVYCPDVPGGVIAHTSKTTDQAGNIVRRSTLELIDYAIGDKSASNRRPGRRKKPLP